MLNIVLVNPQIPPNTGNIARLCAAMQLKLHLVKPLGFSTEDRYLKRAGLDYWDEVNLEYHDSFEILQKKYHHSRYFFFSTKATRTYYDQNYQCDDFLVFGPETTGLSADILLKNSDLLLKIPMSGKVRSLNLSSSVAMVVGEAMRQII